VLSWPCVTFVDSRFDYGEKRLITLAPLAPRVVVIAHAPRGDDMTRIISMRRANRREQKSTKSDLARIDRMKDAEIDYSEIPLLDKSFYKRATEVWPPTNQLLTIRLEADVLGWLKAPGRGYHTRINRILRTAMESQRPRQSRSPAASKKTRGRAAHRNETLT